ncbi:MAG: START-like domain-containing protein [Petrimonas sp.]|nr:START-like domain-containing protein [Petrimonas sp.]
MNKEKFHIEFVMGNASQSSLWRMISQIDGLSEWFADEVSTDEETKQYTFVWNKTSNIADVQFIKPSCTIRFHWLDDEEDDSYFEFALHKLELTGDMTLEITDFAEPDEKGDAITLWETQVDRMKRRLGV